MALELFVRLEQGARIDGKNFIWASHKVIGISDGSQTKKAASGRRRKVPLGWTELQCCYQDGSVEQVWLKLVPERRVNGLADAHQAARQGPDVFG